MSYFVLIIMYYHVKIVCYQRDTWLHEDSSMKIGWLKSRGVESASWATIPPISRDRMAEITRSGIHIVGHDPTDFARSNDQNFIRESDRPRFLREFLYK